MRVAMIGTGYVGLVSGACFADFGHDVTCVDKDAGKIAALERGEMPIYEPGLDELVAAQRARRAADLHDRSRRRRCRAPTRCSSRSARRRAAATAMPTSPTSTPRRARSPPRSTASPSSSPSRPCRSAPATRSSASSARRGRTPTVAVVSNPEFLREGAAIQDFKHPDRIVVGTDDERAREVMAELYRPLYLNRAPILFTGRRTAELIKYAANAFLATKITFINEIADLCEKVGADVQEVARGIGLDNRIGAKFLHAGPGYRRLVLSQGHAGADQDRRRTTARRCASSRRWSAVNDARKRAMARKVSAALGGDAARQDHRRARPHLQAEHRRHARGAVDPADHRAAGHGRQGARLRSGRHGAGQSRCSASVTFCDDAYDCAQGRRRAGDRHRMGAVPRARSRPAEGR